ncbi:MAG: UDP-N-acetylmuramate--L-alanine ligase [Epulopiscium sp. Nele67-Bin004]|nr:MAG: UDP-N-acetylmuramate--L-alanine ligase [Epulopiscium sp. Nele67-Bin004]
MTNAILDAPSVKIHFIGVGGISMSGLAEIMHDRGHEVSGSDMKASDITRHLENIGVQIMPTHTKANITPDIDVVVYTAAISEENEELICARQNVKTVVTRAEFLGMLMHTYDFPICVSGTHGKTTTTSMLANVLLGANFDPTITVGGIVQSIGGNIRIGGHKYFLTEACEYHNSFLDFFPRVGVILNVEEDHMDFFKDINEIYESFTKFASLIPADGLLVVNEDVKIDHPNKQTFGLSESCDWYAKNITFDDEACGVFDVYFRGQLMGNLRIGVTGAHNILNALSVCAVSHFLQINFETIQNNLVGFKGAKRRFEVRGDIHGITLVDDYAHHPTEIQATLEVANKYPHNKLFVIFQPHTYTRTKAFLEDFATALEKGGNVIITDIYAAREKNPGDIHAKDIVDIMERNGDTDVIYIDSFDEIADHLLISAEPGDLIITMGAGNVNQIIDILIGE